MGSENVIGVISGGCEESEVGQDNIMDSLNLDSSSSSKTVNNSSSRQCIICLANVDTENNDNNKDDGICCIDNKDINVKAKQVDGDSTDTGNSTGTDFDLCESNTGDDADEFSLLKLLNVKVEIPFPSQTLRKNVRSTSQGGSCSYCSSCASRNKEVSSLFSQMDELRRKLTGLKDCIELDFKESFERTVDIDNSYSGCINPNDIADGNEFLRYHIAKSFNFLVIELPEEMEPLDLDPAALIPDLDDLENGLEENNNIFMDNVASDDDYNEWESKPIILASKSESSGSVADPEEAEDDKNDDTFSREFVKQEQKYLIPNHVTSEDTTGHTHLKQRHGLQKEVSIRVERLPLHILAQYNKHTSTVTDAAADDLPNSNNSNINRKQLRSRLIPSVSASDKHPQSTHLDTPTPVEETSGSVGERLEKQKLKANIIRQNPQSAHSNTPTPFDETDSSDRERLEKRKLERRKLRAKIIRQDPKLLPTPRHRCFVEGCKYHRYFESDAERMIHMMKSHKGVKHPRGPSSLSKAELNVQVKAVRLEELSHTCHMCGKAFTSIADLNGHIPQHIISPKRPFKCETCLHSFKSQSGLIHHRKTTHSGENEQSHYCYRCEKGHLTAAKLKSHMRCDHTTDPAKLIKCSICGKRFAISRFLTMHMKVHNNQGKQLRSEGSQAVKVSQDTKPCGTPPKKLGKKGTSKPNTRRKSCPQ